MSPPSLIKPDASDGHRLLPDIDRARPDIHVGVADSAHELSQRQIVGFELVEVGFHLELFCRAAPGVDLHDARNRQKAPLQYPVLNGAQIGNAEVFRAGHLVAVDFADQARCLDLRLQHCWEG